MGKLKEEIYEIIRDDDQNTTLKSKIFDFIIISLIIINVVVIFLDTFQNIRVHIEPYYKIIDVVSITVFTIEYILRFWTATLMHKNLSLTKARLKYVFSAEAVIDLIVLFSFYLPLFSFQNINIIRILRLFRILSILKINRYTHALSELKEVLKKKSSQLISSLFVVSVLIIFSALLMYYIENEAQPGSFDNAYSSLWWAIATLTTVGYGDIYPVTALGKFLGIFISLLGIALIAIPTGILSAGFTEQKKEENDKLKEENTYCPFGNCSNCNTYRKFKRRFH